MTGAMRSLSQLCGKAFGKLLRKLASSPWILEIERRRALRKVRVLNFPKEYKSNPILLITTVGNGNVGDQAMFDAFLDHTHQKVVAVVASHDAFVIQSRFEERVETKVLSCFFSGGPVASFRELGELGALVRRASEVVVMGADILDGGYDRREAAMRMIALEMGALLNVRGKALGFSWGADADQVIERWLLRLDGQVTLNVRDIASYRRMENAGFSNMKLVADIAFSLESHTPLVLESSWVEEKRRENRKIVVLNASGLLLKRRYNGRYGGVDVLDGYIRLVEALLDEGIAVILLPHVIREGDNDLDVSRRIFERLRDRNNLLLIDRLFSPSEVRALVSGIAMVFSGRMHLAILSLSVGTPCLVVKSRGKVEGMLDLFDLRSNALDMSETMPETAQELIFSQIDDDELRSEIKRRLDYVRFLSEKNFE